MVMRQMFLTSLKEQAFVVRNIIILLIIFVSIDHKIHASKDGFSFFSQQGWKNCRWGASHM